MKVVSLGYDNGIVAARIVAVANASAAPMRRLREEARKNHRLVDVTNGRRTRAIVARISPSRFARPRFTHIVSSAPGRLTPGAWRSKKYCCQKIAWVLSQSGEPKKESMSPTSTWRSRRRAGSQK